MKRLWLGIETSCDETACAIVSEDLEVLSSPLYSQFKEHIHFGGVVPEIAARAHLEKISPLFKASVSHAGISLGDISAIAYTRGPGLMGPLLVGSAFAKGLAMDLGIPAYGINHLEGHIAAAFLSSPDLEPPFLSLTVSGGHTELILVEEGFRYTLVGRTRDDAAGEAFDKCGKILGLGYPAGPIVSRKATQGNRSFHAFPQGLRGDPGFDFSFSGLKTAVLRYTEEHGADHLESNMEHICASLEEAIVSILVRKAKAALKHTKAPTLLLCGGVSANSRLRAVLAETCKKAGVRFALPAPEFSTDNGAMIAAAAILRKRKHMLLEENEVKPWLPLA